MDGHTWVDVALAFIAALPATIAAFSSLKNGQEQRRVRKELADTKAAVIRTKIGRN